MATKFKQAAPGNYKIGRTQPIEFIVVHYTANKGDTAQNNLDYFARERVGTSAHYFVDEGGVYQSVKDIDTAYHCGSSNPVHPTCRNSNSIGVEMCNSVGKVPDAVRDHTAALVQQLMKRYGVPVENVLRHYDVTGKKCPAPWVANGAKWTEFKAMLGGNDMITQEQFDQMMDNYLAKRAKQEPSSNTTQFRDWATKQGIVAGDGLGNMMWQSWPTREQLVIMLFRALEEHNSV